MLHAWFRAGAGGRAPGARHIDEPGEAQRRRHGHRWSDGHASQQPSSRLGCGVMNRKASHYLPPGLPIPVVEPDGLSAPYWAGLRESRLRVQRCAHCHTWQFGPEWLCHRCHAFDPEWTEVEPRGRIFSWERIWHPSHPAPQATRSLCRRARGITPRGRGAHGGQFAGRSDASRGDRRGTRRRIRASSGCRSAILLAAMANALTGFAPN